MEDGVEGLERARHVQVGEHLPQTIATGRGGALSCEPSRQTGVHGERPLLDGDQRTRRRGRRDPARRVRHEDGRIRPRREWMQEQTLVAIEAIAWPLARRGVHPHIGDVVEPVACAAASRSASLANVAAVDEIVAEIADGPLDFALGLRAIGPTRARREAPVVREAEKLEIARQARRPAAAGHA